MTSNNPFAARIRQAAQEGYVNSPRRDWKAEYAQRETRQERAAYQAKMERDPFFAAPSTLATDKQRALIESLLSERDLAAETRPAWRARVAKLAADHREVAELTREKASNLITYLFGLPVYKASTPAPAQTDFPEVTAGHYALIRNDEICFVRVDRPTEGKWAGKVFVALQHGDDYTNMSRQAGLTMLGSIVEQGVLECSTRYGRELGKCGVCHRTLTNAESRAAGIGPVCREKSGW
jgi:hypothetical protein